MPHPVSPSQTPSPSELATPSRGLVGYALDVLIGVLVLGALRRTFHDSQVNSEDFHVYWRAASEWLAGRNPYFFTAADQGFVFKYPPWILPIFLPIGWLPFETAKLAWFFVGWACVAYVVKWCVKQGTPWRLAALVAGIFWWMFHAHFSAGQFTLVIAVASLAAFSARPEGVLRRRGWTEALLTYVLSAKLFSVATLAGMTERFRRPAPWIAGGLLFVLTHALVLSLTPLSLAELYTGFRATAASGGAELGEIIVRGQGNHGFTALILRSLRVDSQNFAADALTSLALTALLGTLWIRHAKALTAAERWSGWIAIGLVCHPLAWHHSFVLAYPLCTLSAARARRGRLLALSLAGAAMIGLCIPQVLGHTIVKPIELCGVKSWGATLSAVALVLSARRQGAAHA